MPHRSAVTFSADLAESSRFQVDVSPFLGLHGTEEGWSGYHFRVPEDLGTAQSLEEYLELDGEVLSEALRNLERQLESGRLDQHFHRFLENRGDLMDRIEELEKRLRELERELEELPDGALDD